MKKSYLNLHFHLDHPLPFQNLPRHLSHWLMVVEVEKPVDKYTPRTAQNKVVVVLERAIVILLHYHHHHHHLPLHLHVIFIPFIDYTPSSPITSISAVNADFTNCFVPLIEAMLMVFTVETQ